MFTNIIPHPVFPDTIEKFIQQQRKRFIGMPITDNLKHEIQYMLDLAYKYYTFKLMLRCVDNNSISIEHARPYFVEITNEENYELDRNKEYEIKAVTWLGYHVVVTYKANSEMYKNHEFPGMLKMQVFRNVTEIHYLHESHFKESVAFESDIHQTGCTRFLEEIEMIAFEQEERMDNKEYAKEFTNN